MKSSSLVSSIHPACFPLFPLRALYLCAATCPSYLLVYPVRLVSIDKTGFTSALGSLKPKPIVLRLSLADIAKYNLQDCELKPAEFDEKENHIVTSTNNLVIIWDFVYALNLKP